MLEHFSPGQHRIRNEWRSRLAQSKTDDELMAVLETIKSAFVEMAK